MDAAAEAGLTVLRMWTPGVTPGYRLQTKPGVYNEAMFRGLDYVLDEARKRNLKVDIILFAPTFAVNDLSILCCLLGSFSAGIRNAEGSKCQLDTLMCLWQAPPCPEGTHGLP